MSRAISEFGVFSAIVILLLAGCATSSAPNETGTSTETNSPSPSDGRSDLRFDRSNWGILLSDPDAYVGATVDIVGRVFTTPERDGNIIAWQMYANPQANEDSMVVGMEASSLSLQSGDYVRVKGSVRGTFEGENLFGGKIRTLAVMADSATVVDALAAAPAAVRIYHGGPDNIAQNGVIISIKKVEFAETETRVFLTVINDSAEEASFYSFNAKAVQGSRQFDAESGFIREYPEVQSELLPGIESSGVLVFPAMNPSMETQLHLEARNNDFLLDFETYQFSVPAE